MMYLSSSDDNLICTPSVARRIVDNSVCSTDRVIRYTVTVTAAVALGLQVGQLDRARFTRKN